MNAEKNGGAESLDSKFRKVRDLMVLMSKVHPDRVRSRTGDAKDDHVAATAEPDSSEYWGAELVKILSGLAATKQTDDWQPDLLVKILKREAPDVRFVRKIGDQDPEKSQLVRLPRAARPFLLALDAYVSGKSWEEVQELLGRPSMGGADSAQIAALQDEAARVGSFEEAGNLAKRIKTALSNQHSQTRVMRLLHRIVEKILEDKTKNLSEFSQLKPVQVELRAFVKSSNGEHFSGSTLLDFLDAAALRIGKQMVTNAKSTFELQAALQAIHNHDFIYAAAYEAPFAESREDATSKIELLSKIRFKRSEEGLDDLRREVEAFEFQSKEMTPVYRKQIIDFIERKREVYWPKVPRKYMPKP